MSDLSRFMEKVVIGPLLSPYLGPCWLWTGHRRGRNRYGGFQVAGRTWFAHRWLWEHMHGPVLAGLELDHLCSDPRCVNPAHLEIVTHQENVRRGRVDWRRHKACCPAGHPYDAANTRVDSRGSRSCKTCQRERVRRNRAEGKPG